MADAHDHRTVENLARDHDSTGRPVVAGIVAVLVVSLAVLLLHAAVAGQHASGMVVMLSGVVALLVVTRLLVRATGVASRLSAAAPMPEPIAPDDARRTLRRHRRFVPRHKATTLTTLEGRSIAARIVDLSMGGVAVEGRISDLEFATVARVGSRVARPIRRTAQGAVFSFDKLLDPMHVDENLVL